MWNFGQLKDRLADRLAEVSTVFWGEEDRKSYLNEAQRFIASITRGIPHTASDVVSPSIPYLILPERVLNAHIISGDDGLGNAMATIPINIANIVFPSWRTYVGIPSWFILDIANQKAYVHPIPRSARTMNITVSVFPDDMVDDVDYPFNNTSLMEKYQNVLLQIAATYALLKERYDGDAERYYQFAVGELNSLGVNPHDIPPFRQVAREAQE